MKKIFFLSLTLLAALSVVSCKKDDHGSKSRIPIPEAVDIGLVVNGKTVKWASFNLGASKEYEYGNYYAWGETEPRRDKYDWDTYSLANGAEDKLIAYCPSNKTDYWDSDAKPDGPDGELTLIPSNDVAHALLGGKWRMPTLDEVKALVALKNDTANYQCDEWVQAKDGNGNEVKDSKGNVIRGVRITQKSTGNSIFFPAAGYCTGTEIGGSVAVFGLYWSSSVYPDSPDCAWALGFDSEGTDWTANSRFFGFTVRPVTE